VGRGQHSPAAGVGGALAVTLGIGAALAANTAIAQAEAPDAEQPSTTETSASAGPGTARSTVGRTRSPGPRRNLANPAATAQGKTDTSGRASISRARGPRLPIPAVSAGPNPSEPTIATIPSIPAVIPAAAAAIPAVTAISTSVAPRLPVNVFAAQPVSNVVAPPSAALAAVSGISAALPPATPAKLPFTVAGLLAWLGRAIELAVARMLPVSKAAVPQTITTSTTAVTTTAIDATAIDATAVTTTTSKTTTNNTTTNNTTTISAATITTPTLTLEAETLTVTPSKSGSRFSDSSASGGRALLLSKNGTASTTVTLPASGSLVIRARGDQYKGAPSMQVSLDGTVVATIAVSATVWTDYTVPVTASAGTHTVSIAYINELRVSSRKDRNLRVDTITVVAETQVDPPVQAAPYFQQADWLWTPIAAAPTLAAESATWVSYLSAPGAKRVANLYNYGVTLVPASAITSGTPRYDVGFTKAWGADPFGSYTVALPRGTRIPPGSDGHIAVLDPVTGQAFGIWQASYNTSTDTWTGSWGGRTALNGNGIDQAGSATAAGISRAAGVVTAAEFDAAVAANTGLGHALVFSTDIAGPGFVGPAIKSDGRNIAGVATPIPEGYRIQLDPSIDIDAIPGITAGEKVIAKTLQTHGAYVVDQGSARMAFAFETLPEATSTNPGAVYTNAGFGWDYYDMNHIPWSQLRVIAV
jgi:hypothetical protein